MCICIPEYESYIYMYAFLNMRAMSIYACSEFRAMLYIYMHSYTMSSIYACSEFEAYAQCMLAQGATMRLIYACLEFEAYAQYMHAQGATIRSMHACSGSYYKLNACML